MPNILIVEDEPVTAWALAESLSEDGYDITTVDTAEKALAAARKGYPDLLITDLRLPRMGGLDLVRRLKSRRNGAAVIVVTAYGSPQVLRELEACGVHACFPKPFLVEQLRRSVRHALEETAA